MAGLNKYMKQIDTNKYGDYRITNYYFGVDCSFKLGTDIRVICDHIFQRKYQQMTNYWFPYVKIPLIYISWIYWELLPSFINFILSMNSITWKI